MQFSFLGILVVPYKIGNITCSPWGFDTLLHTPYSLFFIRYKHLLAVKSLKQKRQTIKMQISISMWVIYNLQKNQSPKMKSIFPSSFFFFLMGQRYLSVFCLTKVFSSSSCTWGFIFVRVQSYTKLTIKIWEQLAQRLRKLSKDVWRFPVVGRFDTYLKQLILCLLQQYSAPNVYNTWPNLQWNLKYTTENKGLCGISLNTWMVKRDYLLGQL